MYSFSYLFNTCSKCVDFTKNTHSTKIKRSLILIIGNLFLCHVVNIDISLKQSVEEKN